MLPWASTQRWFSSEWPTADWEESFLYRLPHSTIVLARPRAGLPWLQLPVVEGADGTHQAAFWSDWLTLAQSDATLESVEPMGREQSNSSVVLHTDQGSWVTKLYRVVFPGENPDVTLPLLLMREGFPAVAPVRACLRLAAPDGEGDLILGVATELVKQATTARDYFIGLAGEGLSGEADARDLGRLLGQMQRSLPPSGRQSDAAMLAGRLTRAHRDAEAAIAAISDGAGSPTLPPLSELVEAAARVSAGIPLYPIHGDLHLEQILRGADTGWTFIDFEGEPLRSLTERNQPDFALRDLAGLLRSFDYAAHFDQDWVRNCQVACKEGYAEATGELVDEELLRLLMIEKALYEVKYEATFRPDWLWLPLRVFE